MKQSIGLVFTLLLSFLTYADDVVDKVYHPYVLPFEKDVEWRFMSRQNSSGNDLLQRVAFGHALSENLISEVFIVGERDQNGDFSMAAYELEFRWMLTEQGQYWVDWGMLLEVEKTHKSNEWEASIGLLNEKQWDRTSLTTNFIVKYLWGTDRSRKNNTEAELRMKWRYRLRPSLQPAIELYTDRNFLGLGPSLMGEARFSPRRRLKWEVAFISGLNGDSKDHTLRAALEYKF
ncbi:hypothetical protein [Opacimonas viscosa]|uniref:Uncharacterized protein n=1 Tax=Opacimonas viscosa TaxID=2961944 RepID=A0AA41X357_9ALTE|nr:hypothetical protein [Opacimonas viscosa]MCP3429153.1 hypothetical protein [Opacimonas viscosa]